MRGRKGKDDRRRQVSLTALKTMITPSIALNLIAWSVCLCERWTVAEHGDGWMCARSPMSCRYAAQSSTAIKRVKGLDAKTEEQGPVSFGRRGLNRTLC